MVAVVPLLFISWKLYHKTQFRKPEEVDFRKDQDALEDYENNYAEQPARWVIMTGCGYQWSSANFFIAERGLRGGLIGSLARRSDTTRTCLVYASKYSYTGLIHFNPHETSSALEYSQATSSYTRSCRPAPTCMTTQR
jgi:hypothetical protein